MKEFLKRGVIMTAGAAMVAAGVYFFIIPNGFVTGGLSGVGTLLGRLWPVMPAAMWIALMNVLLLVLGWAILGRKALVRTIYGSLVYSGLLTALEYLYPMTEPLTSSRMLELIYAVALSGVGSGLLFHMGGSTGGTDVVAMIIRKASRMDAGKALLYSNLIIVLGAFFVYGLELGLYSLLGLLVESFFVDGAIEYFTRSKYFTVITEHPEEISRYVLEEVGRGVTSNQAIGEYTGAEKWMLHTVCHRSQAARVRRRILELDPGAFVIVTTTSEIIGEGFLSV